MTAYPYVGLAFGTKFSLTDPTIDMVNPFEFHHHLQLINRFGGGMTCSVWLHGVNAARLARHLGLPLEVQRQAFMHDWHEAVVGDTVRPMRDAFGEHPGLTALKTKIDDLVHTRLFGEPMGPMLPETKMIDDMCLMKETVTFDFGHKYEIPGRPEWPADLNYARWTRSLRVYVDELGGVL